MSTLSQQQKLTPQQYLDRERAAEYKSEFYDGEVFAMVGASRKHNLISANLVRELSAHLKGQSCEVYPSDMRVKVSPTGLYTYPDVVVVCDEPQFEDAELDTLLNPTLLCEVLSESTADYDRGRKFGHYRKLDSLKEYVLVDQNEPHVEHFIRQPDDQWVLSEVDGPEATLVLPSIDCRIPLAEIYHKVI